MSLKNLILLFYRPQTKLREGNVFTLVCDSVHRGGVSVYGRFLSGEGVCPGGGCLCPAGVSLSSRGVSVQGDPPYSKERAVRILLECILVSSLDYFDYHLFFTLIDLAC